MGVRVSGDRSTSARAGTQRYLLSLWLVTLLGESCHTSSRRLAASLTRGTSLGSRVRRQRLWGRNFVVAKARGEQPRYLVRTFVSFDLPLGRKALPRPLRGKRQPQGQKVHELFGAQTPHKITENPGLRREARR